MSSNRFTKLNKSQAKAVAEAFEQQAETFRRLEAVHTEYADDDSEKWGEYHQYTEVARKTAFTYSLAAKDADERAADAREIAEGKR